MILSRALNVGVQRPSLGNVLGMAWQFQAVAFVAFDLLAFLAAGMVSAVVGDPSEPFSLVVSRFAGGPRSAPGLRTALGWEPLVVFFVMAAQLRVQGHYSLRLPFWTGLRDIVVAVATACCCDMIIRTRLPGMSLDGLAVLNWVLVLCLIPMFRPVAVSVLDLLGVWKLRTLVVGPPGEVAEVARALRSEPGMGFAVVGTVPRPTISGPQGGRRVSDRRPADVCWEDLLGGRGADLVALVADPADPAGDSRIAAALTTAGLSFAFVRAGAALPVNLSRPRYLISHDMVVLAPENAVPTWFDRLLKRAFDIAAASVFLLALTPLLLAIALMVRCSGGPAFYRHQRIGLGGRRFGCMKFRSMATDGDRVLAALLAADAEAAAEWAATQKLRNDPRITPIGRLLRATSLDELPQLFNVLRGDMSLVGPRPVVQAELAFYGEDARYYLQTRPGLTGLWQVSGRSDTSYAQRVQLDSWYVRNWSLWHDVAILARTVPVVLLRRGAV